jgi:hypothetical protein
MGGTIMFKNDENSGARLPLADLGLLSQGPEGEGTTGIMEANDKELNSLEETQTLTRKQRAVIPHIIGAKSLEAGCRAANVAKPTVYRWLKDKNFRSELERARAEVTREAFDRLRAGVTTAVDGLLEMAEDKGEKNKSLRLRACEKILDLSLKVKEVNASMDGFKEKMEEKSEERNGNDAVPREVGKFLLQLMRELAEEEKKNENQ